MAAQADALRRMGAAQAGGVRGVVRNQRQRRHRRRSGAKDPGAIARRLSRGRDRAFVERALVDLLAREADIAVRMTDPTQNALVVQKAGEIRIGLFARDDYLARRGRPNRSPT